MKILPLIHNSPETGYLVEDYPYGFRLRCKIRYWLETNNKGTRFCHQTTNPKCGNVWNKPKYSTYSHSMAMYLDDQNHVTWAGVTEHTDTKEFRAYLDTYQDNITDYKKVVYITLLQENFDAAKARLGNPEYGSALYRQAYLEAVGTTPKQY